MSEGELRAARAHNLRVAAERKESERRRNNQSAKRARIRKMAVAVALMDEIDRLRGLLAATENGSSSISVRDVEGVLGEFQLDNQFEEDAEDMRRCLHEYARSGDLVEQCTQEFHNEITALVNRGDQLQGHLRQLVPGLAGQRQRRRAAMAADAPHLAPPNANGESGPSRKRKRADVQQVDSDSYELSSESEDD
jgi:hypothetical protein